MESNIRCIVQVCKRHGFDYRFTDSNKNCLLVSEKLFFQANRTPFNNESMAGLCKDKEHQYQMLREKINMPKTMGFLDFDCQEQYRQYLTYHSMDSIVNAIEQNFSYPLVIKQNRGSLGVNVFCCHEQTQVRQAISQVFDKNSSDYDYVVLAQQYIKPQQEIRVIYFDGEPVLSYERVFAKTHFGAKYWETEGGKALPVATDGLVQRTAVELAPALTLPGLRFVGLDIILDDNDQLYLIELNSGPKVNHFSQTNGDEAVIKMYEHILLSELGKL